MEITEFLLVENVRTMLKVALVFLISLLFWLRFYRAAIEDAELDALEAAPLRIVTEEDLEVTLRSMDEEERLAVQRRAEALNWFDEDENEKKSA